MTISGQTNIMYSSVTLLTIFKKKIKIKKSLARVNLCATLSLSLSQTTGRALNNESGVTSCRPAALTTHQAMLHMGTSQ